MARTRKKWAEGIGRGLLFCLLAAGCGGITGDLPPVTGQVTRTDTNEVLPNATVTLIAEGGQRFITHTDSQGRFSFYHVPAGRFDLLVEPPFELQTAPLEAQQIRFEDGSNATFFAIGLVPAPSSPPSGFLERVVIEPAEKIVYLEPQPQTVQFKARLVGSEVAGLRPQWMVRGHIGRIDWQGVFTPTRVGTGLVVARVGDIEAAAVVRVERRPPVGASSYTARRGGL